MAKAKKIDHSLQDEPIVLTNKLSEVKTPYHKQKEKKENKKARSKEIAVSHEIIDSQPVFIEEYYNVHTRQYHPATVKFVELQCVKLKEWADQEDSLNIHDFIDSQGYNPATFYKWCDKFPQLHETHQYAIRRLGSRREMGALTRKFDASTVHRTLGYYHYIWRQETIALAKLKEESAAQNETKVVIIERFPELPTKTPEEVAAAVRKATADAREYGQQGPWKKLQNKGE
jgi:hypothetical protein